MHHVCSVDPSVGIVKILSFDELVAEKMDIKNISMEDAIWEINQRGPKGYLR